jgi:hypothetical protein
VLRHLAPHLAPHLAQLNAALRQADRFVASFGSTEACAHTETGAVYPTALGPIMGNFDPEVFSFKNYSCTKVLADFKETHAMMNASAPDMKFLITVPPVPLRTQRARLCAKKFGRRHSRNDRDHHR